MDAAASGSNSKFRHSVRRWIRDYPLGNKEKAGRNSVLEAIFGTAFPILLPRKAGSAPCDPSESEETAAAARGRVVDRTMSREGAHPAGNRDRARIRTRFRLARFAHPKHHAQSEGQEIPLDSQSGTR